MHDMLRQQLTAARAKQGAVAAVESSPVVEFDPGAATVSEVLSFVAEHPDRCSEVRQAEADGRARTGILSALDC